MRKLTLKKTNEFEKSNIPYMVIGGQAVLFYGEPRFTKDIDITLGVSIEKLDNMIKGALDNGAYGAKLSGAGGGDCMIALSSSQNKLNVGRAIKKVGGEIINVGANAEGVRIET